MLSAGSDLDNPPIHPFYIFFKEKTAENKVNCNVLVSSSKIDLYISLSSDMCLMFVMFAF